MNNLIERYDFMDNMKVDKKMVERFKDGVMKKLESNKYVHLYEGFGSLGNYDISCSKDNEEAELNKLSERLSEFMAYQEAIYDLINEGKLLPVRITNTYGNDNFNVRVNFEIRIGMSTMRSSIDISIPILENSTFMLRPSLRNK